MMRYAATLAILSFSWSGIASAQEGLERKIQELKKKFECQREELEKAFAEKRKALEQEFHQHMEAMKRELGSVHREQKGHEEHRERDGHRGHPDLGHVIHELREQIQHLRKEMEELRGRMPRVEELRRQFHSWREGSQSHQRREGERSPRTHEERRDFRPGEGDRRPHQGHEKWEGGHPPRIEERRGHEEHHNFRPRMELRRFGPDAMKKFYFELRPRLGELWHGSKDTIRRYLERRPEGGRYPRKGAGSKKRCPCKPSRDSF